MIKHHCNKTILNNLLEQKSKIISDVVKKLSQWLKKRKIKQYSIWLMTKRNKKTKESKNKPSNCKQWPLLVSSIQLVCQKQRPIFSNPSIWAEGMKEKALSYHRWTPTEKFHTHQEMTIVRQKMYHMNNLPTGQTIVATHNP